MIRTSVFYLSNHDYFHFLNKGTVNWIWTTDIQAYISSHVNHQKWTEEVKKNFLFVLLASLNWKGMIT